MRADPNARDVGRAREAGRQRALVEALFAESAADAPPEQLAARQHGAAWRVALAAYRANGRAHAIEALTAAYPTIHVQIGAEAFAAAADLHWRRRPPRRGDLAWAGEGFADTLGELPELEPWPWLHDCARLDWARWTVAFAAPARFDAEHLQRLAEADPDTVRLQLADGARLVSSHWPVLALWLAHQAADPSAADLQTALAAGAQAVWVWRDGWSVAQSAVGEPLARWLDTLRAAPTLGMALDVAPDGFNLADWLQSAITHGWLDGVAPAFPEA